MLADATYSKDAKITATFGVHSAGLEKWFTFWFPSRCSKSNSGKSHDEDNSRFEELHGYECETSVRSMRTGDQESNLQAFYTISQGYILVYIEAPCGTTTNKPNSVAKIKISCLG